MYICIDKRLNVHTEEEDKDNVHDEITIRGRKKAWKGYVNRVQRDTASHVHGQTR